MYWSYNSFGSNSYLAACNGVLWSSSWCIRHVTSRTLWSKARSFFLLATHNRSFLLIALFSLKLFFHAFLSPIWISPCVTVLTCFPPPVYIELSGHWSIKINKCMTREAASIVRDGSPSGHNRRRYTKNKRQNTKVTIRPWHFRCKRSNRIADKSQNRRLIHNTPLDVIHFIGISNSRSWLNIAAFEFSQSMLNIIDAL